MYLYHYAKFTRARLAYLAKSFCRLRKLRDLAHYFHHSKGKLKDLAARPSYYHFDLLKQDGTFRRIEAPREPLKTLQAQLNFVLQCVYHGMRPPSVYGFVISAKDDPQPRNIYTHACQHLRQKWVLNLDLRDFFHSISANQVEAIFSSVPFRFSSKAASILTELTTFHERLPMGTPSSPILSNFAARELDARMTKLAKRHTWTYTRFSDDLTFSGAKKMSKKQVKEIKDEIMACGFEAHEDKIRLQSVDDPPEVTGLVLLKDYPDVSPGYLKSIQDDFKLLKWLQGRNAYHSSNIRRRMFKHYVQSIRGKINFVGFVRGRQHRTYLKLQQQLNQLLLALPELNAPPPQADHGFPSMVG